MIIIICRKFGNNIWTLDKVMEFFNDELRAQENFSSLSSAKAGSYRHDKSARSGYYIVQVVYLAKQQKVLVFIVARKGIQNVQTS